MRSLLPFAVALFGLLGCEQRFSSDPPLVPESPAPAFSSSAIDALFAPIARDAGAVAVDSSHAMTVTICSASPQPCPPTEEDASADASYRVVFGSGRGAIRSRGQAMADLYEELRSRTTAGERLDAEPHSPGDAGGPGALSGRSTGMASAGSSDPIARCAFHLLNLVDDVGEVDLNVVHGSGSKGCMVSLGQSATASGASQCLIQEPERPHRPGRKGR
jgi:hypothetical protein